ncbi:MAG: adenylyltransferase/cytidyltransferase family protein [Candidatus Methylacidiphilales bacterium]|nr:adenylyltransferase/cytidyltransferase family protein [Candidatus Methylacidiphilales bacterium]
MPAPLPGTLVPFGSEAVVFRRTLRDSQKRVVATNGCFDVLHAGHLRYLTSARELGDFLWLGINSDESVRQLKGPLRPVFPAAERAELLLALRVVDAVTIYHEVRATGFLGAASPDIYVKGGDYTPETLDAEERAALIACGAEIKILQLVPGRSTTDTLKKLSSQ